MSYQCHAREYRFSGAATPGTGRTRVPAPSGSTDQRGVGSSSEGSQGVNIQPGDLLIIHIHRRGLDSLILGGEQRTQAGLPRWVWRG